MRAVDVERQARGISLGVDARRAKAGSARRARRYYTRKGADQTCRPSGPASFAVLLASEQMHENNIAAHGLVPCVRSYLRFSLLLFFCQLGLSSFRSFCRMACANDPSRPQPAPVREFAVSSTFVGSGTNDICTKMRIEKKPTFETLSEAI